MNIDQMCEDAQRYQWLKQNCIVKVDGCGGGPSHTKLQFLGRMWPDWRFDLDHIGLDEAIDAAMKGNK